MVAPMNPIAFVRALPQPLKALYALWVVGVLVAAVASFAGAAKVELAPMGVIVVMTGLTLLTNYRGSADALAAAMKQQRPLGVDYSRSVLSTPGYARFFGGFALVVGAGFVYSAIAAI